MENESTIEFRLSTKDNPFNPFTEFDKWFAFDEAKGYHTCSYLARIAKTSDSFGDDLNRVIVTKAIDEIIEMNVTGAEYIKVPEPV